MKVYSYSSCGSCKKALHWLDRNYLQYELIDIVKNPPSKETIIHAKNQLGSVKALFNTRGQSYRKLGAEVVKSMTEEEAIE